MTTNVAFSFSTVPAGMKGFAPGATFAESAPEETHMRQTALVILAAILVGAGVVTLCCQSCKPRSIPHGKQPRSITEPAPAQTQMYEERSRMKIGLAQRIIAERIPLLDAAEMFRHANEGDAMHNLLRGTPGRSVREKLCRQAISFVSAVEAETEFAEPASPGRPVSTVLQAELDRRIAAGEFPPDPE